LLERGADVHAVNSMGESPYQVSAQAGNWEIADLLREHGGFSVRLDEIILWLEGYPVMTDCALNLALRRHSLEGSLLYLFWSVDWDVYLVGAR
jgi:ankyrin repeat protein